MPGDTKATGGWRQRGTRNPAIVLALLYLLNTVLVLDKIIFTILLEPIKQEFALTDLQLGLLAGSVYAVFMGLASLPMGLAADRYSRRGLAAGCLAGWSVMTAMCGMAQSYLTLLFARLCVGVGEAGGGPAALSIIADLYEHKRRATAMAIFSLGTPSAALINLTLNTQIVEAFGWRVALLLAAVPGLLLALAIWLFMAEPERGDGAAGEVETPPSLRETLRFVRTQRSLLHLLAGATIAYIVLAGVSSWHFSYLVRHFKVSLADIGPWLGISISGAGIAGLYLAGRLADALASRDERWRARVMVLTTLASVGFGFAAFTTDTLSFAIACSAGLAACSMLWLGPGFALSQGLVSPRMRGTIGAVMFLLSNLIGYGVGPLLVGGLSDWLAAGGTANSLQLAILIVLTGNLLASAHFYFVGTSLRDDLKRVGNTEP